MTPAATLKKLSTLLRADDTAHVDQGVALVLSLDDPALTAALLHGTSLRTPRAPEGVMLRTEITLPTRLKPRSRRAGHAELYALLRLVTASDHPAARKLRARIQGLYWDDVSPIDLSKLTSLRSLRLYCNNDPALVTPLSTLTGLTHLELDGEVPSLAPLRSTSITRLSARGCQDALFAPDALPNLQHLELSITAPKADLAPLGSCKALRSLEVSYSPSLRSIAGLEHCTALTSLTLLNCPIEDLSPLSGLAKLARLDLDSVSVRTLSALENLSLDDFGCHHCTELTSFAGVPTIDAPEGVLQFYNLPALRSLDGLERSLPTAVALEITEAYALTDLTALRGAPKLSALKLGEPRMLPSLAGLEGCDALVSLDLPGATALTDLSALRAHPTLRRLLLWNASSLSDLTPLSALPKLEVLDLRDAAKVTDLTALAACDNLKIVALHGSGVKRADLPAALRAKCTWAVAIDPAKLK